jgi:hypothetical protein
MVPWVDPLDDEVVVNTRRARAEIEAVAARCQGDVLCRPSAPASSA